MVGYLTQAAEEMQEWVPSFCRSFGGPLLLGVSELGILGLGRIAQAVAEECRRQAMPVKKLSLSELPPLAAAKGLTDMPSSM